MSSTSSGDQFEEKWDYFEGFDNCGLEDHISAVGKNRLVEALEHENEIISSLPNLDGIKHPFGRELGEEQLDDRVKSVASMVANFLNKDDAFRPGEVRYLWLHNLGDGNTHTNSAKRNSVAGGGLLAAGTVGGIFFLPLFVLDLFSLHFLCKAYRIASQGVDLFPFKDRERWPGNADVTRLTLNWKGESALVLDAAYQIGRQIALEAFPMKGLRKWEEIYISDIVFNFVEAVGQAARIYVADRLAAENQDPIYQHAKSQAHLIRFGRLKSMYKYLCRPTSNKLLDIPTPVDAFEEETRRKAPYHAPGYALVATAFALEELLRGEKAPDIYKKIVKYDDRTFKLGNKDIVSEPVLTNSDR